MARVNAAHFSGVGVGVMLPNYTAVGAAVYTTARVNAARLFSRWCKRYDAQFTAVGAAF